MPTKGHDAEYARAAAAAGLGLMVALAATLALSILPRRAAGLAGLALALPIAVPPIVTGLALRLLAAEIDLDLDVALAILARTIHAAAAPTLLFATVLADRDPAADRAAASLGGDRLAVVLTRRARHLRPMLPLAAGLAVVAALTAVDAEAVLGPALRNGLLAPARPGTPDPAAACALVVAVAFALVLAPRLARPATRANDG